MMRNENRRQCERVAFLRPIVYIYDNSDKFYEATMLNHSSNGICFQSTPSVTPGAKICILGDECSVEAIGCRSSDAISAKVMWCEKIAGAHWVGVQYINSHFSEDVEE